MSDLLAFLPLPENRCPTVHIGPRGRNLSGRHENCAVLSASAWFQPAFAPDGGFLRRPLRLSLATMSLSGSGFEAK